MPALFNWIEGNVKKGRGPFFYNVGNILLTIWREFQ